MSDVIERWVVVNEGRTREAHRIKIEDNIDRVDRPQFSLDLHSPQDDFVQVLLQAIDGLWNSAECTQRLVTVGKGIEIEVLQMLLPKFVGYEFSFHLEQRVVFVYICFIAVSLKRK
jgi:hypothetical protein